MQARVGGRSRAAFTIGIFLIGLFSMAASCRTPHSQEKAIEAGEQRERTSALRFGIGRAATEAEVADWNVDVMPDGTGLPSGTGSVDAGRAIYAVQCQHCHGIKGQGKPFDQLVGRIEDDAFPFAQDPTLPRTIGSYWPYATTLFDYVRRAMPFERPGSLSDPEVYSLTAYLLYLNGLLETDELLDRDRLPRIVMPAQDRFVPDDRVAGEGIR